jgi:hypothetical protein
MEFVKPQEFKTKILLKLDLFPSSGEELETTTLFGLLERAHLNYWTLSKSFYIVGVSRA